MKKAIGASVAIMAIGILIAGCAQSEGAARQTAKSAEPTVAVPRLTTDELMDDATRAAHVVIGNEIMQGIADCAELGAALRQIEDARACLRQLDEDARAAHVVIGNAIMQGLADGAELGAALQQIEEARQAVLANIGLATP